MLATLAERRCRAGNGWTFEVKWDGYRALAYVRGGECRLVSRNGNDLTERFADVAKAVAQALRRRRTRSLDGEVCALDERGRASFSAMQQGTGTLVYYAFDLLELDGEPLVDLPLRGAAGAARGAARPAQPDRAALRGVRRRRGAARARRRSRASRASSRSGSTRKYAPGRRTRDWLKVKTHGRQEFVIAGYTRGQGRARGDVRLARPRRERGRRAAVRRQRRHRLRRRARSTGCSTLLRPLERATSPFPEAPKMPRVRKGDVVWVEPRLVAEVEFSEWTHDGRLRAAVVQGPARGQGAARGARASSRSTERRPEGPPRARLSNLDKVFWPDEGITKGDLLDYYRAVAPVLVPHLRDRPFTMRRYPDGDRRQGVLPEGRAVAHAGVDPDAYRALVSTRERRARAKWVDFPLVNDELALLWMVNMGCIDMNTWYSRVDRPDRPDFVLFDLDPTPRGAVGADRRGRAARARSCSTRSGSPSFPKTSRRQGVPRARPDRPALDVRRHARRSPSSSPARSRARTRSSRRRSGRRRGAAAC